MSFDPRLSIHLMQTYAVRMPAATRRATCEEIGCPAWRAGWRTVVPTVSAQAHYIRTASRRDYVEEINGDDGLSAFLFTPGQVCFGSDVHRIRADVPEVFVSRDGDARGNPTGRVRRYANGNDWRDSLGENLDRLKTIRERG